MASPVPNVLIIDDDPWVREPLRLLLETLGFEVTEAEDGETALAAVQAEPHTWAFVLLDVRLPRMTCDQVLRGLQDPRPDIPVLLHSGYERWQLSNDLFGTGCVGFLEKPATVEQLSAALEALGIPVPDRGPD